MFREGRNVENNKRRCEKNTAFFSLFFHWFFVKNRHQIVEKPRTTALCTKIDKESMFGPRFSTNESIFSRSLASLWVPRGLPRRPGASQKPSWFSYYKFSVVSENRPGSAYGRPQEGPGCPPGTSRAQFWVHFGSIFELFWWGFTIWFGDKVH